MIKIRLARRGRKKLPFYHVLVADSRYPRDGKFIAKLGWYNPLTKESSLNIEDTLAWINKGAQPTDGFEKVVKVGKYESLYSLFKSSKGHKYQGLDKKAKADAIKKEIEAKKEAAKAKNQSAEQVNEAGEQTEQEAA